MYDAAATCFRSREPLPPCIAVLARSPRFARAPTPPHRVTASLRYRWCLLVHRLAVLPPCRATGTHINDMWVLGHCLTKNRRKTTSHKLYYPPLKPLLREDFAGAVGVALRRPAPHMSSSSHVGPHASFVRLLPLLI